MNKMENYEEFHDRMLDECPLWIVIKAVKFLKKEIPLDVAEQIKEEYEKDPGHWCTPYHFSWGMFIRNKLRDNVCLDDKLPSGNFDDYYVRFVEIAVGARSFKYA
jgi:hypothetical protein